jgi:hypothetical protein
VQHKIRSAKRAARSELSVSRGEWRRRGYADGNGVLSVEGLTDGVPRVHISVGVSGRDGQTKQGALRPRARGATRMSGRLHAPAPLPLTPCPAPPPAARCISPAQELAPGEFAERFERPRLPVVVTGLLDAWPAQEAWAPAALLERFGTHKFKVRGGPGAGCAREEDEGCWRQGCARRPCLPRRRPGPPPCSPPPAAGPAAPAPRQVGSDDDGYAVRLRFEHFLRYATDPEHSQVGGGWGAWGGQPARVRFGG